MTTQLRPSRWYDTDPVLATWLERIPLLPDSVMGPLVKQLGTVVGHVSAADSESAHIGVRWSDRDPALKTMMQQLKTAPPFVRQAAIMLIRQAWQRLAQPVGTF